MAAIIFVIKLLGTRWQKLRLLHRQENWALAWENFWVNMIILSRVLFLNWVIVGMPLTKENVSWFPSLSIVLFAYLYDEWLLQQENGKTTTCSHSEPNTYLARHSNNCSVRWYIFLSRKWDNVKFDWLFSSMRGVVKLKMWKTVMGKREINCALYKNSNLI